jgi:outer membrane lipoprotein-sorting protein
MSESMKMVMDGENRPAGGTGRPGAAFVSVLALLVSLLLPAAAQAAVTDPVPLPRLRPVAATEAPPPAAPQPPPPDTGLHLPKFLQPKKDVRPSPFTPAEQADLANINAYFNSFRTMEGQFTQVGPNGEQSEGVFFISRPGKIRFHYRPPVKLDIISDGSSVAVRDNKAMTQDLYPLSKTPLRYLLADQIDLTSGDLVRQVREEPDLIALVLVEKSSLVEGKLTLIFDRKTYELRQWIVTDAQGLDTSVTVFNTAVGKPQDPSLFRIGVDVKPSGR